MLSLHYLIKIKKKHYWLSCNFNISSLLNFVHLTIVSTFILFFSISFTIYFDFLRSRKNGLIKGIALSSLIVGIGFGIFNYVDIETGGYISQRLENIGEDQGSGRLDVYENVFNLYETKDWNNKLFGSGFNSVIKDNYFGGSIGMFRNISAHNDFLEVLYDFGIIGLFIYLVYVIRIVRLAFSVKNINENYYQANIAMLIIFFVMSMVSHLMLYPTYYVFLIIIVAITNGQLQKIRYV